MATIRDARAEDAHAIRSLLQTHGLRVEGVLDAGTKYWVAGEAGEVVGAIGLELAETSVLLRSAIVEPSCRGKGLGANLTAEALSWARAGGYLFAYCFSTDAGGYWLALGFCRCPVDELVQALPNAPQVRLFDDLGWLPTEEAFRIALN